MAIKTFDSNRIGGGTFQLEQNPLTGEYQVKEVGFIKLPELKLPEIEQAAPKAVTPDDPTDDTATDPGFNVGGQTNTDTGRDDRQDFTGAEMLKNIKTEATGGETLMESAEAVSDRLNLSKGAIESRNIGNEDSNPALKAYNDAIGKYNLQSEINRDRAMGKQELSDPMELTVAKQELDTARLNYEKSIAPEIIKAAPVISENLQKFGPTTVVEDISKPAQKISVPEEKKEKVSTTIGQKIDTALRGLRNLSLTGMLMTIAQGSEEQQALNKENSTALKSLGYQTNFELGISTDPGRIAGSPADNVFAGMNAQSARGNIFDGAQKRIDTRNSAKTQERISKLSPERQAAFNAKTAEFAKQLEVATTQKNNQSNQGNQGNARDDRTGDPGGNFAGVDTGGRDYGPFSR